MVDDAVNLDLSAAFAAIEEMASRITQAGIDGAQALRDALTEAIAGVDGQVEVTLADPSDITSEIDGAVSAADGQLQLDLGDTAALTDEIDQAIGAADGSVSVDLANPEELTSEVEDAVGAADATVAVSASGGGGGGGAAEGADEAASGLLNLANASNIAKGAAAGAKGEISGVGSAAAGIAGPAGVAVGAVTALVAVLGEAVNKAAFSQSATLQLTQALGPLADEIEHVDTGGLDESLNHLAVRLGGDDDAIRIVVANLSLLGAQSGKTGPEIVALDKTFINLAAHVAATHPQLGTTDQILQKLPLALSRGGKFAAGFGINLTQADIAAEALAEGITKPISAMSVYEKATLGATLVTKRLGDSLATDINTGADSAIIKLRVFREKITEAFESAGAPLLGVATKLGADIGPVIEGLIGTITRVGGAIAAFLEPIIAQLGPSIGDIFSTLNDVLDPIIPLLGLAGKAFGLILTPATLLLDQIRQLADYVHDNVPEAFRYLEREAVKAILPIIDAINYMIEAFNRLPVIGDIGTIDTSGLKGLGQDTEDAATAADDLTTATTATAQALDETTAAAAAAATQFGGGALFSDLATGVEDFNGSLLKTRGLADDAFAVVLKLGTRATPAIDLLVKSFDKGGLSATEFNNVAAGLGLTVGELATLEKKARDEADAFDGTVTKAIGNVVESTSKLDDQGKAHIGSFIKEIQSQALAAAAFTNSIQTLFERGATQLAETLLAAGPAAAGAAREAAKSTDAQLAKQEEAVQTSQKSYTEQAAALETYKGQVIDKTSSIVDAFGNLAPKPAAVNEGIDEALLGAQSALQDRNAGALSAAEAVGAAIAAGLAQGISQGQEEVNRVVSETIDGALLAATAAGEIHSPSRLFSREVGIPIDEGIADGIRKGYFKVDDAVGDVITALQQQAKQQLDNVFGALQAGQGLQGAQQSLADAQTKRADLITQQGTLGVQIKNLSHEINQAQQQSLAITAREQQSIDRAQQSLDDLRATAAEQAHLPQDIDAATRQLALESSDLADLTGRLEQAKANKKLGTGTDDDVKDAQQALNDRQKAVDDAQKALDDLTKKQSDNKVSANDLEVAQEDLNDARADAIAPTQELTDLQGKLKDAQDQQKQTAIDLAQATKDIKDAQLALLSAYEQAAVAGQTFFDQGDAGQDILRALGDAAGFGAGQIQGLIDQYANFSVLVSKSVGGAGALAAPALTGPGQGKFDVFGNGQQFTDTAAHAIDARNYVRAQSGDAYREPGGTPLVGTANFTINNQDPNAVAFAVQSKLGLAAIRG